jgi:membrane protease YdiL (CAAX protease family)
MNLRLSLVYFGIPTLLLFIATHFYIPFFSGIIQKHLILGWYSGGLLFVFLPMFIASVILYKRENKKYNTGPLVKRFWLQRPDKKVIIWSLAGIILCFSMTYLFMQTGKLITPDFSPQPDFMQMEALKKGELWLLIAWLPMYTFNILGEAFYWRGYIFPRQFLSFGKYTWLIHGLLWWLFHLPMGLNLMFTLIPIIFITTFVVQKTRSTWSDIIIHGAVNGTGFIMVAFGLIASSLA